MNIRVEKIDKSQVVRYGKNKPTDPILYLVHAHSGRIFMGVCQLSDDGRLFFCVSPIYETIYLKEDVKEIYGIYR
jgi:hypothetical protein